jgi:signal transduction histidine kinase
MLTEPRTSSARRPGVLRWRTLRTRVTVIASLAITAAVAGGLILLYLLLIDAVGQTLDGQLRTYATQISQSAPNGDWPKVLEPSTLDANAEAQVIAADGHILSATRTLVGLPAVYALPAGSTTPVRLKAADGVVPGEVRVVAVRQTVGGQQVTIIAGTATGLLSPLRSEFASHLVLGLPVILLAAAAAVWLIVGRALRPVERIRRAVTDITSADLSQRVPEPGTPDEIGHLAQTMNEMLGRLEGSARRQRRFVADASHELRSPLAAIRTTLEVGLAHPDRAPWPVIAERAAQQSNLLEGLIQQLLLLAKADERLLANQRQRVDVAKLLREVCTNTVTHRIDVKLELPSDAVAVGNAEHLARLFRNVIDNAIRYATSTVSINAAVTAERVVVEIADDGPGIAQEDRDRIFDRFVRLDSSRERSKGTTGLGLAIAREIATAHHGAVDVADNPSGGARFVIWLPCAPRQNPGDA